jgi:cell division initiation protein
MPLTPLDIHNKEFSRAFRGYDEDEVNEFLDRVIKDYEALIRENKELYDKIGRLEERLAHFTHMEESLSRAIVIAQETAEEVKNNANKEAQLIIREAEQNADRIVNEALARAREASMGVEELKRQVVTFRARLRSLIQTQLEIIDGPEWDALSDSISSLTGGSSEPPSQE